MTAFTPAGTPVCCGTVGGELTIGSQTMHTFAWCAMDLTELFPGFRTVRGGPDVVIPGANGRTFVPRRTDTRTVNLRFIVSGYCSPDGGTIYADQMEGLATNLELLDSVFYPADPIVYQSASLVLPGSAGTIAANVRADLQLGSHLGDLVRATLALTILEGRFS